MTDHSLLADAVRVFGWLLPGEVRTYPTDELEAARAWMTETVDSDG